MSVAQASPLSRDAIKRKADRAQVRSMGGDPASVDIDLSATLDSRLVALDAADEPLASTEVATLPAEPPVDEILPGIKRRRFVGRPSTYPETPEAEQELLDKLYSCAAHGYSLFATAAIIEIPHSTILTWAKHERGANLRECLNAFNSVHRGAMETIARDNIHNKDFNNRLFQLQMQVQHEPYRNASAPAIAVSMEKPDAMSQFEFERRLETFLHKIEAQRRGEIPQLPASERELEAEPATKDISEDGTF